MWKILAEIFYAIGLLTRWKEVLVMRELSTVVLVLEGSQNTSWPRWHNCCLFVLVSIWHGFPSALWESRPAGAGQALPGESSRVLGWKQQGWQSLLFWPSELWLYPRDLRRHLVSGGQNIPLHGTQAVTVIIIDDSVGSWAPDWWAFGGFLCEMYQGDQICLD